MVPHGNIILKAFLSLVQQLNLSHWWTSADAQYANRLEKNTLLKAMWTSFQYRSQWRNTFCTNKVGDISLHKVERLLHQTGTNGLNYNSLLWVLQYLHWPYCIISTSYGKYYPYDKLDHLMKNYETFEMVTLVPTIWVTARHCVNVSRNLDMRLSWSKKLWYWTVAQLLILQSNACILQNMNLYL